MAIFGWPDNKQWETPVLDWRLISHQMNIHPLKVISRDNFLSFKKNITTRSNQPAQSFKLLDVPSSHPTFRRIHPHSPVLKTPRCSCRCRGSQYPTISIKKSPPLSTLGGEKKASTPPRLIAHYHYSSDESWNPVPAGYGSVASEKTWREWAASNLSNQPIAAPILGSTLPCGTQPILLQNCLAAQVERIVEAPYTSFHVSERSIQGRHESYKVADHKQKSYYCYYENIWKSSFLVIILERKKYIILLKAPSCHLWWTSIEDNHNTQS